ncbi:MAG: PHP domain-containing protein [Spirochaetaceae bacterium]|jgi:hypothetical protein|nr:PHP domain-containing protein [Spirochaetaceae bacterium]
MDSSSKTPAAINDPRLDPEERLAALRQGVPGISSGMEKNGNGEVNNHIHTIYSFSPYTPSMAALKAREAGLEAAGSVDHDSWAAAPEMIAACAALGMGGCSGFEIRVSFKTGPGGKPGPMADRKINNPDSAGLVYMTIQGIPSTAQESTAAFLKPIREFRLKRTRQMTEAANVILAEAALEAIDYERDLIQKSQYLRGGEITERHLLAAAAEKIITRYGRGIELVQGLRRDLTIPVEPSQEKFLADPANPHYLYDLLGVLKTGFLPLFFIQPDENECIPAKDAVDFALSIGAIPAYAYLGDVGNSPTGDKKAEKFEDDFLSELFEELHRLGYRAVTYMPPRNSPAQIEGIQALCARGGLMEISGVDINSSRQSFNCPEVLSPRCRHLVDTTWALIAHERLASVDSSWALFSSANPFYSLSLQERIILYARAGRSLDLYHPEESVPRLIEELLKGRLP